eukprot:Gb_32188 [translate_table: standard]
MYADDIIMRGLASMASTVEAEVWMRELLTGNEGQGMDAYVELPLQTNNQHAVMEDSLKGKSYRSKPNEMGSARTMHTSNVQQTRRQSSKPATNPDFVISMQAISLRKCLLQAFLNQSTLLGYHPSVIKKVFPEKTLLPEWGGDLHGLYNAWGSGLFNQPLTRKCETLAVSGLAAYGDEIDVVAPVDILKQIFKIPYTKARLSVAVHRIGRTLILNTGPDIEEGEKLVRRKKNQSKGVDQSLFLNFAMHSVRAEACDCPPSAQSAVPEDATNPTVLPGHSSTGLTEGDCLSSSINQQSHSSWQFFSDNDLDTGTEAFHVPSQGSSHGTGTGTGDSFPWGGRNGSRHKSRLDALKRARHVGEKQWGSNYVQKDSEKHRRFNNGGFLRVLFWQFHNLRMLLGSDLLLFSNEKHAAVSLHLWEVERQDWMILQVTPLMWLDAWLDNVMASIPELAICYHHNGVVQGYELLKTDDIFLLKGIAEDGTAVFHPQVVQQNGLSVLKFLQDNCKQDPGSYWVAHSSELVTGQKHVAYISLMLRSRIIGVALYKNAGEDLMQLFDLSVLSKNCSSDKDEKSCSSLPSSKSRRKRDYSLPLGILLYRLAHRLSLSKAPNDRSKCAKLFKKCLEFLNEQEHLVIRACAHEQVARLILRCYEELGSTIEALLLESESSVIDVEKISPLELSSPKSESIIQGHSSSETAEDGLMTFDSASKAVESLQDSCVEDAVQIEDMPNVSVEAESRDIESLARSVTPCSENESNLAVYEVEETSPQLVQTVADPISAKLAAVHHVSQAIKSLRWQRQLQDTEVKVIEDESKMMGKPRHAQQLPVCVCGEVDCIEVCDLREWLAGSRMDRKLWQLVLLLGESYLALGQAYKDDGQLQRALKVGELACSVYGSMPSCLEEVEYVSVAQRSGSELCNTSQDQIKRRNQKINSLPDSGKEVDKNLNEDTVGYDHFTTKGLFWGQTWIFVGDIYVEYQRLQGEKSLDSQEERGSSDELKMASEVMKEVKRLKKKLGQSKRNCNICSLTNCSCQSDRASSGNSASSSSSHGHSIAYLRKQSKRTNTKHTLSSHLESSESDSDACSSSIAHACGSEMGGPGRTRIAVQRLDDDLSGSMKEAEISKGCLDSKDVEKTPIIDTAGIPIASKNLESKSTDAIKNEPKNIFRFLQGPKTGDLEVNFSAAIECYDAARDALLGLPAGSQELQSAFRKKGWACNELGRRQLANRDLESAELAFAMAIQSFREVKDYTNIVLINCNLGHGRRALAEALISKIDSYKQCGILQHAYKQTLNDAKFQYGEALKYYGAAKFELNAIGREADSMINGLWNEVYTQYAHTYLRLGMLLAREDVSANVNWEEMPTEAVVSNDEKTKCQQRKYEISANDAIREALVLYESLGALRGQEAAFAHFQLACYHRDCCLKALNLGGKEILSEKGENANFQQARRYASLAERYWQKAIEFYCAETHPDMFLQILMERSALCLTLSTSCHSNTIERNCRFFMLFWFSENEATESELSSSQVNILEASHKKWLAHTWDLLQLVYSWAATNECNHRHKNLDFGLQPTRDCAIDFFQKRNKDEA